MVSPRFMNAPIGNLSMKPPYTPMTEMTPPLRHERMAWRSTCGRSVSIRVAVVLDLERPDVGEGHADVLGLATGIPAGEVRVPEDARGREPEHLLGHVGVGVRVLTQGVLAPLACEAGPAGDGERHDDAV